MVTDENQQTLEEIDRLSRGICVTLDAFRLGCVQIRPISVRISERMSRKKVGHSMLLPLINRPNSALLPSLMSDWRSLRIRTGYILVHGTCKKKNRPSTTIRKIFVVIKKQLFLTAVLLWYMILQKYQSAINSHWNRFYFSCNTMTHENRKCSLIPPSTMKSLRHNKSSPLRFNPFMSTVPTFAVRETDVSRHNGGISGAPLKLLRDDSALRALSSLEGLRGAPEVPHYA